MLSLISGGVYFEVGIDSDHSGILENGEIVGTGFICEIQNSSAEWTLATLAWNVKRMNLLRFA